MGVFHTLAFCRQYRGPDWTFQNVCCLLKSIKRPSSLPMQISTRYLQFGQNAGGKISTDQHPGLSLSHSMPRTRFSGYFTCSFFCQIYLSTQQFFLKSKPRCFRTLSVLIFSIGRLLHIEIIDLTYRNAFMYIFLTFVSKVEGADS